MPVKSSSNLQVRLSAALLPRQRVSGAWITSAKAVSTRYSKSPLRIVLTSDFGMCRSAAFSTKRGSGENQVIGHPSATGHGKMPRE